MNVKNFFLSFFVGLIVYWLSGGLFYEFLFKSLLPAMPEENSANMMKCIIVGCMLMTLLLTYIFNRIGGLNTHKEAVIHGGVVSLIVGGAMHAFYFYSMSEWSMIQRGIDLCINFIMGVLTSSSIYHVLRKFGTKA